MTATRQKITIDVTPERLVSLAREWSEIAGETVRLQHIKGAVYGFCSELGALRLEHKYNCPREKARAFKSAAEGWCFCLYLSEESSMQRLIVILEGQGGPLDRSEVTYDDTGDDPGTAASLAIHDAIETWMLSPGDTIKIREPGREE
jgi:hypothetical protein